MSVWYAISNMAEQHYVQTPQNTAFQVKCSARVAVWEWYLEGNSSFNIAAASVC